LYTRKYWSVVQGALLIKGFGTDALWGDGNPSAPGNTQTTIWNAYDPHSQVDVLASAHLPFYVSARSGWGANFTYDALEAGALDASRAFILAYEARGGSVQRNISGNGTHSWPTWEAAFDDFWKTFLFKYLPASAASTAAPANACN